MTRFSDTLMTEHGPREVVSHAHQAEDVEPATGPSPARLPVREA